MKEFVSEVLKRARNTGKTDHQKAGCCIASFFDDPHNVNTTHGSGEQAWLRYHLLPSSITFETSQGVVGGGD